MTRKTAASHAMTAVAFILCTLLSTSSGHAQNNNVEGLEQTYARLCGNGQNSEACPALRAALMAKLSGQQQSAAPAAPAVSPSAAPTAPAVSSGGTTRAPAVPTSVWDFYSRRIGTKWLVTEPGYRMVSEYEWLDTGRVIAHRSRIVGAKIPDVHQLTYNKELALYEGKRLGFPPNSPLAKPQVAKVEADGSLLVTVLNGEYVGEGLTSVIDDSTLRRVSKVRGPDGAVVASSESVETATRLTDVQAQALVPTAEERTLAEANDVAMSQVAAEVAAQLAAAHEPAVVGVWAFYSRLAGNKWLTKVNGHRGVEKFDWVEQGRVLRRSIRWLSTDQTHESIIELDSRRSRVVTQHPVYRELTYEIKRIEPDGSFVLTHSGASVATSPVRWEVVDNTHLRHVIVSKAATGKTDTTVTIIPFIRITASNEQALGQTAGEKAQALAFQREFAVAMARQAAADSAAAANAKKSGGGGLLRAAIGAGLGLAAANAGGMDATQTLGAAAKGVALMNPESQVAQVVGASGDAVLQSLGLGATAAGATSTGGSGASYPKRTNFLLNQKACEMMNESNYRTVGVSGGNDVQLKTMCAQAYEYYSMYVRAREQGYSEADANRTYAAHQQAAQNAISFYANNRAQ